VYLRLTALVLVSVLLGTVSFAALAPPAAAQATPGLTLPFTDPRFTEGEVVITRINSQAGQLVADGTLTGTLTDGQAVTQQFRNVPLAITSGAVCEILTLDLGPIDLDLLGLVVNLSAVELDVTAESGPGNLLGNLLCAVAGLLDQGGDGGPNGILNQLLSIINRLLNG
jgi:hypothetical protein